MQRRGRARDTNTRAAWDGVPDVLYRLRGPEGACEYLGGAFERITGFSPREWVGRPFIDLIQPDDRPRALEHYQATLRGERVAAETLRFRDRAGGWIAAEVHSAPLVERGRVVGAIGVARDVTERRRSDLVENALFRISEAAHDAPSLEDLFAAIHRIVGELMSARNLYIALYDRATDLLSFPYMVDEFDVAPPPATPGRGLTEYVLRSGRPLLVTPEVMADLKRCGEVELIGSDSVDWLGVPLVVGSDPIGVLAVQSYTEGVRYAEADRDILQFVATQVAMTVERKRAEDALRASEEQFRRLVEVTPDGIAVHREGRLVYINPAGLQLLGARSPAEVLGRPLLDFVDRDSRPAVVERVRAMTREGEPVPVLTERFLRLDGTAIDVEVAATPLTHAGPPAILVVVHDLGERVRAETLLKASEERLQRAASAGNVGLWDSDLRTGVVVRSPEWKSQIGYAAHEIPDTLEEWRSRVHPDDLERAVREMEASLAPPYPPYESEFRLRHKDGSYRRILARGALLFDEQGAPTRMLGTHVDITERSQLEQQLLQAQKMESVGRLAGGVAHDFNNLLTVINSAAELALLDVPDGSSQRRELEEIRSAARRAANLTSKLLAFSRQQLLQPVVLDLNVLVASTESMLRRLIGEDIDLIVLPGKPLGSVRADPGQIEQVILNLAVNARDAMPTGGKLTIETGSVELDAAFAREHPPAHPGRYVLLAVGDTGHGMDAATRERIFEPFFTTKGPGQGTGLGLSTVYGIVKQSGGYVWVESEVGAGSTFRIYLPQVAEAATETSVEPAEALARGSETILLVEDDESLRRVAARLLGAAGYTVVPAGTVAEALQRLERHEGPVDLVLTDVVLPGASGLELAERLAAERPGLRILLMSGHAGDEAARLRIAEQGVHFLPKPFALTALARKVREVLDAP